VLGVGFFVASDEVQTGRGDGEDREGDEYGIDGPAGRVGMEPPNPPTIMSVIVTVIIMVFITGVVFDGSHEDAEEDAEGVVGGEACGEEEYPSDHRGAWGDEGLGDDGVLREVSCGEGDACQVDAADEHADGDDAPALDIFES